MKLSSQTSAPYLKWLRSHRSGAAAMVALTSFLFMGTAPQTCNQPAKSSNGPIIAAAVAIVAGVAVTTVVLVEVHHGHHTVKGCVTSGPNGLQIQNEGDKNIYAMTGVTQTLQVGDRVRLSGSRAKQKKGSTGDRTFVVEKLSKDYGPCKLAPATPTAPPSSQAAL